jgi:thioredoxin:protein disulfide reductase
MKSIFAALSACLFAILGSPAWSAEPVVSVKAIPPSGTVRTGKPVSFPVELSISKPYHINSNQPLEDYLIPTTVELEPIQGVTFGKVSFPAAEVRKLPVSDSPMAVYEGVVNVDVEMTLAADLQSREVTLRGAVRYQACDDRACLPPTRQPFSLKFKVADSASSGSNSAIGKFPGRIPGSVHFGDRSLLATLLLVFIGGLALNLTPCVYPMIPITIAYFGGQAQGKKGSILIHSVLYTVGMATTYSILGVAAALTGGFLGAALQYPLVLIGIALIMVSLALSMFDVYELRMPSFLNRLAGSSQKGFGGTFLMGLTVGIVAAPCIGPFVLGLLTYVGNRGSAALGFGLFFVLALGLGMPFLILGLFSGSVRKLPRSGAWMVWVRKIFGFILLAMAVFFLKTLLPNSLIYHLALALILLLAGIYLAWIDPTGTAGKAFPYVRHVVGIVFFGAALYFGAAGVQNHIENAVFKSIPARTAGQESSRASAIEWIPFSDEALNQASKQKKPVFIDFYADWCAPCKELDTHTFSTPEVVSLSREFVMLKVDLTLADDPKTELLRKRFDVRGVPTLVFLKPDGEEVSSLRGTGFESKDVFLGKMKQILQLGSGEKGL